MNAHWATMLLAAAWIVAATSHGFAENDPQSTPDVHAAAPRPANPHRPDKIRTKPIAKHQPADRAYPPDAKPIDEAAARAASLERRRKAFFANTPKPGEAPSDLSSAPVGVTLGGSGGLSPEMGWKF